MIFYLWVHHIRHKIAKFEGSRGPFKKYFTRLRGRGVGQKDDKGWYRGEGVLSQRMMSLCQESIVQTSYFSWFMCFIITILLTFYVVVHLDNTFCVENLLITANMGPKVPNKFRLMFTLSLSLFMVCEGGIIVEDLCLSGLQCIEQEFPSCEPIDT